MGFDTYNFDIKDNTLMLRTISFRTDKGSVLHSGIYNREMASTLAAGACITLAGFFFATRGRITALHFVSAIVIFTVLFLLFRTYVFREPVLYTAIDKTNGIIELSSENIFGRKKVSFPLSELESVRQDYVSSAPVNPDGIEIVQKIALQHGTVIPGFGETAEFYTVELEFKNGRRELIFSSKVPAEADGVATNLKKFMER